MGPTILLSIWGVAIFSWFFLHEFPRHELAEHLLEVVSENTGLGTSADSARFDWPARISYDGLHLVSPSFQGPIAWEIPRFSGSLNLISLVSGKPRYNFDVKAYGGEFRGRLLQARHGKWNHLRGKTIHPINLLETKKLLRQNLSGRMNLETDYTWIRGSEQKGHGILNLAIENLVLHSLNINGIPLPNVVFETVNGRLFLHDGQGKIESLVAEGPLAHVTGTGTILLRIPYQQSLINMDLHARLRGQLKAIPLPSLETRKDGTLHIHLQGPLSAPSVALNGLVLPR
ncbi:MAG: type II secretion system protein GspN [Leptospirales bacterium]